MQINLHLLYQIFTDMASANLLLDKRSKSVTGKHPVKLQIYFAGKQFIASSRIYATSDDYDKALSSKNKSVMVSQLRIQLDKAKTQAEAILTQLGSNFNLEVFRRMYYSKVDYTNRSHRLSLKDLYEDYMRSLEENGQYKSFSNYKSSMISFLGFCGDVDLQAITPDLLKKYQRCMLEKGRSISTVYSYMRPLRAIYSKAIEDKLITNDAFPFGDRKFSIGSSVSAKSFLYQSEIKDFWNYVPENDAQQRVKDYWFFIYFCNGIAPVDVANLTSSNLSDRALTFTRQKTLKSKSVVRSITAFLRPEMIDIIARQGNTKPDPYIFPILKSGLGAKERLSEMEAWRRESNKILNRIGKKLKLHTSLCLYSARHSYGNVMKLNNVSPSIVRDAYGHSDFKTTENYLGSIPMDNIKEISDLTANFKL